MRYVIESTGSGRPWSPSAAREFARARAYQLEIAGDLEKAQALRRLGPEDLEDAIRFSAAWRRAIGEELAP